MCPFISLSARAIRLGLRLPTTLSATRGISPISKWTATLLKIFPRSRLSSGLCMMPIWAIFQSITQSTATPFAATPALLPMNALIAIEKKSKPVLSILNDLNTTINKLTLRQMRRRDFFCSLTLKSLFNLRKYQRDYKKYRKER